MKKLIKINKGNVEGMMALTPLQKGILFHYLQDPKEDIYFEQLSLELVGAIDSRCFEKAWHFVVETNEMLRTTFRWKNVPEPVQVVLKQHPLQVNYFDFSGSDEKERNLLLEGVKRRDRKKGFNLEEVPFRIALCRLEEERYELIISSHHILYDGWSSGIILKEFFYTYHDLVKGNKVMKKMTKPGFKELVKWTRHQDRGKQQTYWQEYLQGAAVGNKLPGMPVIKRSRRTPGNYSLKASKGLTEKLALRAKQYKITMAALLYSTWGILFQRYSAGDEVIIGTTVSGRSAKISGIEHLVGLCANTLPLRIKTHVREKAIDLVYRTQKVLEQREKYEHTPLVDIKTYSGCAKEEELFEVVLSIENYPLEKTLKEGQRTGGLSIHSYSMTETTPYMLAVALVVSEEIEFNLMYDKNGFKGINVERLVQHFIRVLEELAANPGKEVLEIDILTPQEKQHLLMTLNDTGTGYPQEKTIHELFAEQAEKSPGNIALISSDEGLDVNPGITYRELNKRANQLAQVLKARGVTPQTIVCIMAERSNVMVVGILAILKAGGVYLPIDPRYPAARIRLILQDTQTKLLLTQTPFLDDAAIKISQGCERIDLEAAEVYQGDAGNLSVEEKGWKNPAYVIYTSGSTGQPKGVMIQHRSVVQLLMNNTAFFEFNSHDIWTLFHSFCFDFSVWEMYGALLTGGKLIIIPFMAARDPQRFHHILKDHRVTVLNQTPSAFYNLINREFHHSRGELNLRLVIFGGEALNPVKLKSWQRRYPEVRLINMYGITETTVHVTYKEITPGDIQENISNIGGPLPTLTVYIMDNQLGIVPIGVPGELWVGGSGVGIGYLNRPLLTSEKFRENPHKVGERLYRSGDRVRRLENGALQYLGRIDHQVQIRGYRVELGEIENCLSACSKVDKAVVVDREDEAGDRYLCAYIVSEDQPNPVELRRLLTEMLPDYMIPDYIEKIARIPLTPNGKLNRSALPPPGLKAVGARIGKHVEKEPLSLTQRNLVKIWSEVLKVREEKIGSDANFFEYGGHSLKVIDLIGRIHREFNTELSVSDIFTFPTIHQLSTYIEKTRGKQNNGYSFIEAVEKKEYYDLSSAQKRLFLLQQKQPDNTAYHITGLFTVAGNIRKHQLKLPFSKMIARHESLRTSFVWRDSEPMQKIHDEVEFEIEYYDPYRIQVKVEEKEVTGGLAPRSEDSYLSSSDVIRNLSSEFIRPFDLSNAPLLRVGIARAQKEKYLLIIDVHHIISDGWSVNRLIKELMWFHTGEKLPKLRIQYKDFAQWEHIQRTSGRMKTQEAYWLKKFQDGGELQVLQLPTDFSRPVIPRYDGNTVHFSLQPDHCRQLKQLGSNTGTTLFIVLVAVVNVFLAKISGQEDIVLGTPVAGRLDNDLDGITGMFVNTLAIRNFPNPAKTFREFLEEVKENWLNHLENQDYPFADLVEKVNIARDSNRHPLFDVMIALQNLENLELKIPGLTLKTHEYDQKISKFDMTFNIEEKEENLDFSFSYSTHLFKDESIKRWIGYLQTMLSDVLAYPGKKLSTIRLINETERKQLLHDFNRSQSPYPFDKTLHHLFETQVKKETLNRTALVFAGRHLTYGKLNAKTNQLAGILRVKGVKPDTIVGLMVECSLEMIVAVMAILKAGGAYLPISPEYPRKRKQYMLEDSEAMLLLTGDSQGLAVEGQQVNPSCDSMAEVNLRHVNQPGHLAYTIYTSGSTGRPRGVMVDHKNAVNTVTWFGQKYRLNKDTRVLQTSDYTFDPSVNQVFATLLNGGILHLIDKETLMDVQLLRQYINRHQIHILDFVPRFLSDLLSTAPRLKSICKVIAGGETLSDWVKDGIIDSGYELYNHYGPTETTIDALVEKCSPNPVTLGKPIANTRCYVLDKNKNLSPIGIPGELYIAGAGVARGYLNDPGRTREMFNPNPFAPGMRMYKSGDMVKRLPGGNIQFLGRNDHQVKIRGFRIELGEIENQLVKLEGIKQAVVVTRDATETETPDHRGATTPDNQYLCAYILAEPEIGPSQLKDRLSLVLPDYMVPSYIVPLERLPVTTSGKIDRNALPQPDTALYIAPRDEIQKALTNIWSRVLKIEPGAIGIETNFFELGGHSLKATVVASEIHKEFDIKIPLHEILKRLTIKSLAQYLNGRVKEKFHSIEPTEEKEYYPLSSVQKRLYIFHQLKPNNTIYNLSGVFILEGELHLETFNQSFKTLIHRHESLRTSFITIKNESDPVQRIHKQVEFNIEYKDIYNPKSTSRETPSSKNAHLEKQVIQGFIKPFDLYLPPLLRVGLVKIHSSKHLLMVDMPHIISDGASIEIFVKELLELLDAKKLAPLRIRYRDYCRWQQTEMEKETLKHQENYWEKSLGFNPPTLNLPTDFERPPVQSSKGQQFYFDIQEPWLTGLKKLATQEDTTLYMVVLAIFNLLLSRICGQQDIMIGVPVTGRNHLDLQNVIGMFVNMLVLRNNVPGNITFREFLEQVKEKTLNGFENQDVPFETIVDQLILKRDISRNPLFDVMFDLQKIEFNQVKIPALKQKVYPYDPGVSRFDLTLIGEDTGERLSFMFEYCTELFKRETIERFTGYFLEILATVVRNRDIELDEIEISFQLFDETLENPQIDFAF